MKRWFLLILAGATSCIGIGFTSLEPGGHRVLFIGNSLTYTNDLPTTVATIAASVGDTVRVSSATGPSLALIDHINGATDAVDQIHRGGWEMVILQQGPTPAGICRDSLILWTKMFDERIRAAGAKTAVLMTWPYYGYNSTFAVVHTSFEMAAQSVNGVFIPAGDAWYAELTNHNRAELYSGDGFHPSDIGTFLTALVIYERITGHDARLLPPKAFSNGREFALPIDFIRELQSAAHDANVAAAASASHGPSTSVAATAAESC